MTELAGVVFDMDGLLLDTEQIYFAAFRRTLTAMGLAQNDDLFRSIVGTNALLGRQMLQAGLGKHVDLVDFDKIWDADIAVQLADGIPTKPGAAAFARHLQHIGLPYIIATSTRTARAHEHLAKAGLAALFPDVIGGELVERSKPAPDIYLHAARTLGLPPAKLAAFEDSANGVRAAHTAGLTTVQIPDVVPPDAALRTLGHHIAPDLLSGARLIGIRVLDTS